MSCLRKKRFDTRDAAQSAIFRMRARNQDTERLEVYACQYCQKHHIRAMPFAAQQSEARA